ncbi:MAG: DUF424 family protein [Candidatus Pacearchaeota archaeon]|nr:DUF424 family protein [Candidatus Pacearchaeota archaeon]
MFIKLHKSYRTVIAVCDSNLIGKKFKEKQGSITKQLDITESFYKGKEISYNEAVSIMKTEAREDSTFNIVGSESIKAGIEAGIIIKEGIKKTQNIPYALVLL